MAKSLHVDRTPVADRAHGAIGRPSTPLTPLDLSPRGQRMSSLAQLVRSPRQARGAGETIQRRVMTFASEASDPEVTYSATQIAKGEGLQKTTYVAGQQVRTGEKEIFVGHSAGGTLDGDAAEPFANKLIPGMDKARSYEFVIAACKTGQDAGGFASALNSQLTGRGMTQVITAPKNALTVVNSNTFLQAEGLDPWQHPAFGDHFTQNWRPVLQNIFNQSIDDIITVCMAVDYDKGKQREMLRRSFYTRLADFLGQNGVRDVVRGAAKPPQNWVSTALFDLGAKLQKFSQSTNDIVRLEQRLRTWLSSGLPEGADGYIARLSVARETVTTAALQNFMQNLSEDDRRKVKAFNALGGADTDWYHQAQIGLD